MRIITGSARGCRLKTPKGMSTRPTSDRIKESLFNILGNRVYDCRVLDLFAGTGNLGLEALSRGAVEAVLIDKATAPLIRENAVHTKLLERAEIRAGDVTAELGRLARGGRQFDLIFCDPPYRKGLWEQALQIIDRTELLAPGGILIVEQGGEENVIPELQTLNNVMTRTYGRTTQLRFYEHSGEGES